MIKTPETLILYTDNSFKVRCMKGWVTRLTVHISSCAHPKNEPLVMRCYFYNYEQRKQGITFDNFVSAMTLVDAGSVSYEDYIGALIALAEQSVKTLSLTALERSLCNNSIYACDVFIYDALTREQFRDSDLLSFVEEDGNEWWRT